MYTIRSQWSEICSKSFYNFNRTSYIQIFSLIVRLHFHIANIWIEKITFLLKLYLFELAPTYFESYQLDIGRKGYGKNADETDKLFPTCEQATTLANRKPHNNTRNMRLTIWSAHKVELRTHCAFFLFCFKLFLETCFNAIFGLFSTYINREQHNTSREISL